MRFGHDVQLSRLLCLRDRGDCGRAFRVDVTTAAGAEAVIRATRATFVRTRVDRGRARKRMPSETARSGRHLLVPVRPAERRHRELAATRRFEDVSTAIDFAVDVPRLPRYAELVLDRVVVTLELFDAERPVFDGRARRDPRCPVASSGLADDLEVPRAEPPALRPVVKRRTSHRVHHRMERGARRGRRGGVRPMGWHFAVRLLHRLGPGAIVVSKLVGHEVLRREPRARLESDDVETGLRERKHGHAASGAHANDHHIGRFEVSGHGSLPWRRTWRSRMPTCEPVLQATPSADPRP